MFNQLLTDAKSMKYWSCEKLTSNLSLEQEFLLTLMKLRVDMLNEDLAFRVVISVGLRSQLFFIWVRLVALGLHF